MQQSTRGSATHSYTQGVAWTPPAPSGANRVSGLLPAGPSCQPCPECGGLECLCRPRFFAGQLLTEQDLNRLEDYILAKNRLHNRYLVGHGVVCGLEVTCSPCGASTVQVSPGTAIDTCGNDIIVCSPDTVDICALIKACAPASGPNCATYKDNTYCKEATQEWILAIRYQESPSRGITPLTGASQCSCGATGGGSCSCGGAGRCGCGSGKPAASCCGMTIAPTPMVSTMRPRRGAPASCEPTVTCEGYCYDVFVAPAADPKADVPVRGITGLASGIGGELFERLFCCVKELFAIFPAIPALNAGQTAWSNFCCNLRAALIRYTTQHGGTDCALVFRLRGIDCPAPDSELFGQDLATALEEMAIILFELAVQCVCSAALPPCPDPGDPRVPLASVTVRVSDCSIVSICDWTPLRKHVVTNRTLGYWLGWLPFVPMIRQFMSEMCCDLFGLRDQLPAANAPPTDNTFPPEAAIRAAGPSPAGTTGAAGTTGTGSTAAGTTGAATPAAATREGLANLSHPITFGRRTYTCSTPIAEAITANLQAGPAALNFGDLLHALLDPIDPGSSGPDDPARSLRATPHAKVLAEIARPLMNSFAPLVNAASGGLFGAGPGTSDVEALRAELETLKTTVSQQQTMLEALRQPPTPPPANPRLR